MTDPLKPTPQLLIKLGSLIVHAEEAFDPKKGHHLDLEAFRGLMTDPDVIAWIKEMNKMALLPVKR